MVREKIGRFLVLKREIRDRLEDLRILGYFWILKQGSRFGFWVCIFDVT